MNEFLRVLVIVVLFRKERIGAWSVFFSHKAEYGGFRDGGD